MSGGTGLRSSDRDESPGGQCVGAGGENQSLVQSINSSQMVEAHTRAMFAQSLPPLPHYSGEGVQSCEEGFDFEEHARIVRWLDEHCKYHLKMLLDKAAFQTYHLLPESVKASYNETVEALRKRFKPVDIEELRGIEFHQMVQGGGGVRAACSQETAIAGKDLHRLLKGRYFQVLDSHWQRKLGAPKPEESFDKLFNRA